VHCSTALKLGSLCCLEGSQEIPHIGRNNEPSVRQRPLGLLQNFVFGSYLGRISSYLHYTWVKKIVVKSPENRNFGPSISGEKLQVSDVNNCHTSLTCEHVPQFVSASLCDHVVNTLTNNDDL